MRRTDSRVEVEAIEMMVMYPNQEERIEVAKKKDKVFLSKCCLPYLEIRGTIHRTLMGVSLLNFHQKKRK
jgi:hypothetical protein